MKFVLILAVIALTLLVVSCFRSKQSVWQWHEFPGLKIETPDTEKVSEGIPDDVQSSYFEKLPYRLYSFDGRWEAPGTGPHFFLQEIRLFIFPDVSYTKAPVRFEDFSMTVNQNTKLKKPNEKSWQYFMYKAAVYDFESKPEYFKLLEENSGTKIFSDTRSGRHALYLVSTEYPYVLSFRYWADDFTVQDILTRIKRIQSSMVIDWEKMNP